MQKKIPSGICRNNEEAAGNAPLRAPTRQLKTVGSPLWLPQIRVLPSIFSILPFLVLKTRVRAFGLKSRLSSRKPKSDASCRDSKSGDRPQARTQVFRIKVFSYWDPRSSHKKTHKKFPITPVPLLLEKKYSVIPKSFVCWQSGSGTLPLLLPIEAQRMAPLSSKSKVVSFFSRPSRAGMEERLAFGISMTGLQ